MTSFKDLYRQRKLNFWSVTMVILLGLFLVVLLRTAWVTEDAYITFRPVENFVAGNGPVYNVGERVQAYTHPLWFLLQSLMYWVNVKLFGISFTEHLYFLNIFLSVGISALVAVLYAYWGGRDKRPNVVLALVVMVCSKAFMEYSTSGLENPLSHLLVLSFLLTYLHTKEMDRTKLFTLALLAGLGTLNRYDLLLVFVPVLAAAWWKLDKKLQHLFIIGIGFLPMLIWMGFSLVYYGFAFPNTAYAKLNTGATLMENLVTAGRYYFESLIHDPVTLVFILVVLGWSLIKGTRKQRVAGVGLLLYLVYILYIGGDYMSGRFLSVPLITAAVLLLEIDLPTNSLYYGAIAIVAALGLMMPRSPLLSPLDYGSGITKPEILYKGIADHRAENYMFTGLMAERKEDAGSRHASKEWTYSAKQMAYTTRGPAGQQVYQWGPNVHVVDRNGLVDALIARIPHTESRRPGHFWRVIPDGYLESLESGENLIADPDLAVYYDHLSPVIHGPVFSRDRLREIWRFNTGFYNEYMAEYVAGLEGGAK